MKIYLVGGAIRDELLELPVKDRDWVVVGATPQQMLDKGYSQVGKDFPVFIHPKTGEEYALARTERKKGVGYTGFECYSGQDVSLEDDLKRRDITINAMARDDNGDIIDPYRGRQDIKARQLRHVSSAFVEDPLRVLRVARFLSRFATLGFAIADETLVLMSTIAKSGELAELTPERVWTETEKALMADSASQYFATLKACDAINDIFPELSSLFGGPGQPQPDGKTPLGPNALAILDMAVALTKNREDTLSSKDSLAIRFATLTLNLSKPAITGQPDTGNFDLLTGLCKRYRVPTHITRIAELVARYHTHCHNAFELKPATLMQVLEALDAFRRPETLNIFLSACEANEMAQSNSATHSPEQPGFVQADYFRDALMVANRVDTKDLIALGFKGKALGIELRSRRIAAIRKLKIDYLGKESL